MKKTIQTFGLAMVATALIVAPTAFAADVSAENQGKYEAKDNGGYTMKGSASETMANGTEKSAKTKVDVDINDKGLMTKHSEKTTTTDPEGMMNEKKTLSKTEIKEKERGGYEKKTVSKKSDAEGTDTKTEASVDVNVDDEGNITEKNKTVKTTDPKGLFNEHKTVSTTKKVNGKIVEQKSDE